MLPYLDRQAPWFAFIAHPRHAADLLISGPGRFLRSFTTDDDEIRRQLCEMPAIVAGRASVAGSALWGEIVVVTVLPEDMMGRRGRERVLAGVQLAIDRGARTIGLGALTSPATLGGRLVASQVGDRAVITNGNAFTAAVIYEQVRAVLERRDGGSGTAARDCVAVVGCTGSVGVALCELLAADGVPLNLVGRSAEAVRRRFSTIPDGCTVTDLRTGLRDARVVVTLTHDAQATVRPLWLAPRSVVVDCAQPPNVDAEDLEGFRERDIEIVEGAVVRIPGFDVTYDFHLRSHGGVFACLAETYLFARFGIREHSVGHPSAAFARHLGELGQQAGITAVFPSAMRTAQQATASTDRKSA